MEYKRRTTRSGDLLEVEVYATTKAGKQSPRASSGDPTPKSMALINERNARNRMRRLLCANFSRKNGDMFVTFTYEGDVEEEYAMREERNLLARIRRLRKRKGLPELKYMVVTEKQSKWHHHVIMSGGLTYKELQELWGGRGKRIHKSVLDDSDGFGGLVTYLNGDHKPKRGAEGEAAQESVKQPRRKGQRRWHASRNLKEPDVVVEDVKRLPWRREPKPPKGYKLMQDEWRYVESQFGIYTYAAFMRIGGDAKPKEKRTKPKGGKGRAKRSTRR